MSDIDAEIDFLCENIKNTQMLGNSIEEYEKLIQSQNLRIHSINWDFINYSKGRYRDYLANVSFEDYEDAGLRIQTLIYDFIRSDNSEGIELMACKCQVIDRLIIELVDWVYAN